ncbi:MAG: hypothetical protein R3B53_01990 [Candidatus Paceibacterota bacterium]
MRQYFLSLVLLSLPFLVTAATSDFTIRTTIVDDANPPTTPTLLSVTPVASTQIDISWSTSTDDYLMGGYVLLRDGTPRATTTLTNFSDTGLTASTTYSYEVYAFDWTNNISSTSNALATTTLEAPVQPTSTVSTTSPSSNINSNQTIILKNINIQTQINSASLVWQTNVPSRYFLRWGRTDAYDGGYIANETYQATHNTVITNLEPDTVYLYELVGTSPAGINVVIKTGYFRTAVSQGVQNVQNVSRLTAEVLDRDVKLTWQLPIGDYTKIRIVRNHLGYPSDPLDGAFVYEGLGESYLDRGALNIHSPQYYTVFVIGEDGTVSSGAVVSAYLSGSGEVIEVGSSTASSTGVPVTPDIPLFGLDINDIVVSQGVNVFTFLSDSIALSHLEPFTISITHDALPKHLKSIIVTLLDPTDHRRSYSFLLKINNDGDAYEATIAPLNVLGVSRLQIEIFDYERMLVGKYQKQLDFKALKHQGGKEVIFPDAIVDSFSGDMKKYLIGLEFFSALLIFLLLASH